MKVPLTKNPHVFWVWHSWMNIRCPTKSWLPNVVKMMSLKILSIKLGNGIPIFIFVHQLIMLKACDGLDMCKFFTLSNLSFSFWNSQKDDFENVDEDLYINAYKMMVHFEEAVDTLLINKYNLPLVRLTRITKKQFSFSVPVKKNPYCYFSIYFHFFNIVHTLNLFWTGQLWWTICGYRWWPIASIYYALSLGARLQWKQSEKI